MTYQRWGKCHGPDCDNAAVWLWHPPGPTDRRIPLCDDCAARMDINDLIEAGTVRE